MGIRLRQNGGVKKPPRASDFRSGPALIQQLLSHPCLDEYPYQFGIYLYVLEEIVAVAANLNALAGPQVLRDNDRRNSIQAGSCHLPAKFIVFYAIFCIELSCDHHFAWTCSSICASARAISVGSPLFITSSSRRFSCLNTLAKSGSLASIVSVLSMMSASLIV